LDAERFKCTTNKECEVPIEGLRYESIVKRLEESLGEEVGKMLDV